MPYNLEYWSPHKAIVVNTLTGHHMERDPIPIKRAKAQLRLLEALHAKEIKKPSKK